MRRKTYLTFMVIALLAVSSIFTIGLVNAEDGSDSWKINVEEGTTDRFGGGAYRYFRFSNDAGTDAMFGVIWGTEDNPNSIVMVSTQARYLAQVNVQMTGQKENQENQNRFVKMNSMLGTTIGRLYEYNDSNQNGVVNFILDEDGEITSELEEVYKYVNLKDAEWTSSTMIEEKDGDNTTWEFTLTAKNLTYRPVGLSLSPGMDAEVLEYVNFTFHLTAGTRVVEDVKMPSFNVKLRQGIMNRKVMQDVQRNGTKKVSGVIGDYDMKWDHEIDGWDFEQDNQNPMLVMGFHNMYGNRLPDLPNRWQWRFMHQIQPNQGVRYQDQSGEHETNFSEPEHMRERILKQNRIEYGTEWSRAGRFKWESNVTVDGNHTKMTAQILGGAPMIHIGPFTRNFIGFQIWGGLNYPGGEHIYHDPAQAGSAYLEVTSDTINDGDSPTGPGGILARPIFMVLIAGLALVVIVTLLYRKGDDSDQRNRYDRETTNKEEYWTDYYDRER
ncbi:MAG: hypothetical protein ACLFVB_09690 [Thermoplasmata archaeon]